MYQRIYSVYIMTNVWNTTFYIGITGNLEGRVRQHKSGQCEGFTKRYHLTKLVYYEQYNIALEAIRREKQLKNWHRVWKISLVRKQNPEFRDLAEDWQKRGDPETSSG